MMSTEQPDPPHTPENDVPLSVRERVLKAVGRRDITRDRRGIKWWTSETESRLLTKAERQHLRALMAEGAVRFETAGGYPNGWQIGGYALAWKRPIPPAKPDTP